VSDVTLARALRDWRHKRELDRWARLNAYPKTVRRTYWTPAEYEDDAARLKGHGYTVATEDAADPNIDVTPESNIYSKDPQGSMPMSIAMFHVTYERPGRA
jgi:hypothetical protein